jgi:hypothetical protein
LLPGSGEPLALQEGGEAVRGIGERSAVGAPDVVAGGQYAQVSPRSSLGDLELGAHLAQRHVRVLLEPRGKPLAASQDDVEGDFHYRLEGAGRKEILLDMIEVNHKNGVWFWLKRRKMWARWVDSGLTPAWATGPWLQICPRMRRRL